MADSTPLSKTPRQSGISRGCAAKAAPLLVLGVVLLAGCASPAPSTPALPRAGTETVIAPAPPPVPPKPPMTWDEVKQRVKEKKSVDEIVGEARVRGGDLDLPPAKVLELTRQGLPVAVLEGIYALRQSARETDCASRLLQREQELGRDVQQREAQIFQQGYQQGTLVCRDPFYGPPFPRWPYRRW
ncbi:hypothetical protein [Oryzomicrobium sp.]|uniref:hypothetical protein n=1 Tax=Oryzomicrobium sp. TaxID=1911578 RepID=UPI0025E5075F|nr:hypothetical protein [Oryzomicrobium sp.]MCE1244446.1 hypothetical protein [Oryzomicrobium sp.]